MEASKPSPEPDFRELADAWLEAIKSRAKWSYLVTMGLVVVAFVAGIGLLLESLWLLSLDRARWLEGLVLGLSGIATILLVGTLGPQRRAAFATIAAAGDVAAVWSWIMSVDLYRGNVKKEDPNSAFTAAGRIQSATMQLSSIMQRHGAEDEFSGR